MIRAILLICRNIEHELNKKSIVQFSQKNKNTQVCFADNNSTDNTINSLNEIKEVCENVTVVSIKQKVTLHMAKRAGARYLLNKFKVNFFGYVNLNETIDEFYSFNQFFLELDNYHELAFNKKKESLMARKKINMIINNPFSIQTEIDKLRK